MDNDNEFQLAETEVQELRRVLFGEDDPGRQRRQRPRFSFPAVQFALPLVPGRPMDVRFLRKVLCRDISRSGISFYWPSRPDFTQVCIGLRNQGNVSWVKARVVHCKAVQDQDSRYLVGCAFAERVESPLLVASIAGRTPEPAT